MKKLISVMLLTVLVCSFMVGAIATTTSASGNTAVHCSWAKKIPLLCDMDTCIAYATYICDDGTTILKEKGTCCEL